MKINQRNKEILVGAFLLFLLFLVLSFAYRKKQDFTHIAGFELSATFNKVDGITEGSLVRLGGTTVGRVSKMELDDYYRIRMTISFLRYLKLPLDTAAIIETDGLIGKKYIELMPGAEEEMLTSGQSIMYTQDVLLLDELLNRFLDWMRIKKGNVETTLMSEGEKG